MSTQPPGRANPTVETAIERIRGLNDRIVQSARQGGEESIRTYERLLENLADAQESAGERGGDFVREFAGAQAAFTRRLARGFPDLLQQLGSRGREIGDAATERARQIPGVSQAEGLVRGAVSREGDLPIADYDELNVEQVVQRLPALSEVELRRVEVYEARTKNRRTVHDRIDALRAGAPG